MILITDGDQTAGRDAKIASQELRGQGVIIFGVGVGSQIDVAELESWVSVPVSEHYFMVNDFASLQAILQKILDQVCPHGPPPVVSEIPPEIPAIPAWPARHVTGTSRDEIRAIPAWPLK